MKKILIVEDDLMVADMLEDILKKSGFVVCGIARTPKEAKRLAEQHQPELAVVDVHLIDGVGTDVATDLIKSFQTGILYTTGNVDAVLDAPGHACLSKPFRLRDTPPALNIVIELIRDGKITSPIPQGLQILSYAKKEG